MFRESGGKPFRESPFLHGGPSLLSQPVQVRLGCQRHSKSEQNPPVETGTLSASCFRGHHLLSLVLRRPISLQDDDLGVVHETIDPGGDRDRLAEDSCPRREHLVEGLPGTER